MITGSKREQTFDDSKMIGMGEFEVVDFNKELDQDGKPIKYLGESKDGNTTFRVVVSLKQRGTNRIFPLVFFLENKEVMNKEGTSHQYVNSQCRSFYSDSVENLPAKFTAFSYHKARVGEVELLGFQDAWLNIDRKKSHDMVLEWDQLMKGSVKELKDMLKSELAMSSGGIPQTICAMAIVNIVEKTNDMGDKEVREYQKIYNRYILPGYNMRFFRNHKFTAVELEAMREQNRNAKETKNWLKGYERFAIDITDPQYGCKDAYYLGEMKPYNSGENVPAGDKALVADNDATY